MPVTPRYKRSSEGSADAVFHSVLQRQCYVTWNEPFKKPAPYWTRTFERTRTNPPNGLWYSAVNSQLAADPSLRDHVNSVMAKAYDKFVDKVADSASLAMLVMERREALAMVTNRAMQLVQAYRHLRKGRFRGFLNSLSIRPLAKDRQKRWSRPKDASAIWLEYWFGWAPTIADIGGAVDILQSDFLVGDKVRASSSTVITLAGSGGAGTSFRKWKGGGRVGARYQAYVTVTNPNLFRANQLGFINPALIVWELIPFSFIVDWFIPVGSFLRSFSDFVGCELTYPMTSTKIEVAGQAYWREYSATFESNEKYYEFVRGVGVTVPKPFSFKPFGTSITRAATAISLVISIFAK